MNWLAYRPIWDGYSHVGILENARETVSIALGCVRHGTVYRLEPLANALPLADHLALQAVTAAAAGLPRATLIMSTRGAEVELIVMVTPERVRELAQAIRDVVAEAEARTSEAA